MNRLRWCRNSTMLTALIGTAFFIAYPVLAQNPGMPKEPDQPTLQRVQSSEKYGDPLPDGAIARIGTVRFRPGTRPGVRALAFRPDGKLLAESMCNAMTDDLLGATLQPVDESLRSQLEIPAGQGLLVASLWGDSPCAQVGLVQNDVLLTLADKPLATVDDLTKQLKSLGETIVPLKVLRAGKLVTIQIRPSYRVTFGPVDTPKSEYYIGVHLEAVSDALRTQLALPADQGVVISDVIAGGPAEKAGFKKHDIVLQFGGKSVASPEELQNQIEIARVTPTTLKLLRAGKPMTLQVTCMVRKVEVNPREQSIVLWDVTNGRMLESANCVWVDTDPNSATTDLRQRLNQLEKELKALHETLDKVNENLKAMKKD